MDSAEFRKRGHELIDWIADYYDNIEKQPVLPKTEPGDVAKLLPREAPAEGESFDAIMRDMNDIIVPHITHWQHPLFMAFFSANTSFPSILGDLACSGLGVQGMLWITSPACTEVETVMMDWLARMMQLPEAFLSTSGTGGGVIQGTASEASLCCLVAARHRAVAAGVDPTKFIVYVSDQTHSSIQKACQISGIALTQLRVISTEGAGQALAADRFEAAVVADKEKGLHPGFVCATVGTTATTANDDLAAVGKVANAHGLWYHVDAAFAGSFAVCPEFRPLLNGVELADSYNFNPHKALLVNFDCSALWVRERAALINAMSVLPEYLKNKATESGAVIDYRDWQIPLGRRFRALKLWFVMRTYGVKGLQEHLRRTVRLATAFEDRLRADPRFSISAPRSVSLVCFRANQSDEFNKLLLDTINAQSELYITHCQIEGAYTIRIAIAGTLTEERHCDRAWEILTRTHDELLAKQ